MRKTLACALALMSICAYGKTAPPYSNWYFSASALSKMSLEDGSFDVHTSAGSPLNTLNFPLLSTSNLLAVTPGSNSAFDSSYDEDNNALRFAVGKLFRQRYQLEAEYSESVSDINQLGNADASGELRLESFFINGWYNFRRDASIRPYLGAGIGQSRVSLGDIFDDVTSYQVGGGIAWHPIPALTLDLAYRKYESDDATLKFDNGELASAFSGDSVALNVRFNIFASRTTRSIDNLPQSRVANTTDCGATCIDSDLDGLADDRDKCPDTPAGAQINIDGCIDSDGDNVADINDLCAGTPLNIPVMTNGCAVSQSTILQGVNFELGSTRLTHSAQKILDRVADSLRRSPGFGINVIGHTDYIGLREANMTLSEERAKAVVDYLSLQGISADRMNASGRGEEEPIAENETAEGRATNRRVEIMFMEHDPQLKKTSGQK